MPYSNAQKKASERALPSLERDPGSIEGLSDREVERVSGGSHHHPRHGKSKDDANNSGLEPHGMSDFGSATGEQGKSSSTVPWYKQKVVTMQMNAVRRASQRYRQVKERRSYSHLDIPDAKEEIPLTRKSMALMQDAPQTFVTEAPIRQSRSVALRREGSLVSKFMEGNAGMSIDGLTNGHRRLYCTLDAWRGILDAEVAIVYLQDPYNPGLMVSISQSHVYGDICIRPPSMLKPGVGLTGTSFQTGELICGDPDSSLFNPDVDGLDTPDNLVVASLCAIPIEHTKTLYPKIAPVGPKIEFAIAGVQFMRHTAPGSNQKRKFRTKEVERKSMELKGLMQQCIEEVLMECRHHVKGAQAKAMISMSLWMVSRFKSRCYQYQMAAHDLHFKIHSRSTSPLSTSNLDELHRPPRRALSLRELIIMFKEIIGAECAVLWLAKARTHVSGTQVLYRDRICHELACDSVTTMSPVAQPAFGIVTDPNTDPKALRGDHRICDKAQGIVGTALETLETANVNLNLSDDGDLVALGTGYMGKDCRYQLNLDVDLPEGLCHKADMSIMCMPIVFQASETEICDELGEGETDSDLEEGSVLPNFNIHKKQRRSLFGMLQFINKTNLWKRKKEFFSKHDESYRDGFSQCLRSFFVTGARLEQGLERLYQGMDEKLRRIQREKRVKRLKEMQVMLSKRKRSDSERKLQLVQELYVEAVGN